MLLPLIAGLPFLGALLPALMARLGRNAIAFGTMAATFAALALILRLAPQVLSGGVLVSQTGWMPGLGLSLSFRLDGLGLLFCLLILGIGLLIQFYARAYLAPGEKVAQFYTSLMLFQGAMLGIVLAENVILLVVFWELTSLASFLLIGHWRHDPAARAGARMALAVTGTGGLALTGGLLLLARIAGSADLSVILTMGPQIRASPLYLPALLLILLGAFTKSAQVPFHFWLPQAMAAPTPVSAYLHSATMVKAGIFLMARLWPVLSGTPEWFAIITTTGLVTLLIGAWAALFRDDLKAVLAYSTVSQLGLMTLLLGIGTPAAATAALLHILNHAAFKAALFMAAGIVDHATHTRSIARLGGLAPLMPVTATLATLAALSMAGVPPSGGFLSKEMMLEQVAQTNWATHPAALAALVTLGALLSAAYAFRLVWSVFFRPAPTFAVVPHEAAAPLWLAPALLAALAVALGIVPALAEPLIAAATRATTGTAMTGHLQLWHGFTTALWLSLAALAGGAALAVRPPHWLHIRLPGISAPALFHDALARLTGAAGRVAQRLHDGRNARSLAALLGVTLLAGVAAYLGGTHLPGLRAATPLALLPVIGWALLICATGTLVARHHNRLLALLLLSVIGLVISLGFLYLSAPDLALTQIAVEVVTLLLLLLALALLPAHTPHMARRLRDVALAVTGGTAMAALAYAIMMRDAPFASIAAYHIAHAYDLGGGNNVVNVILVDFRGYDTFGEIAVLGIAGLILAALANSLATGLPATAPAQPHSLLLQVVARALLPLALLVAAFLFLRGHQLPGGGFVAGLVVATALLLQQIAGHPPHRLHAATLIGAGLLVSCTTGIGSWLFARPFLTSSYDYFRLPPFRAFELATAMAFDAGILLTVLGATLLMLESLARLARHLRGTA